MSQTRAITEMNVRYLIDDLDPEDYAISSVRMHQYLQGQMHLLASRMVLPMEAVTSVAVVAGTYDYTLTGTVGDIRQIQWNATGGELEPMLFEELNAEFKQDTAVVYSSGTPRAYAPFETSAQASKIRVAPTPAATGTLKVYYGIIPAALTADSSVIPFSAPMLRILERLVASECVSVMSPEDRKRRMLGTEVVAFWARMVEHGISDENFRMRTQGSTQRRIQEVEA
jgi:hypothetical protein